MHTALVQHEYPPDPKSQLDARLKKESFDLLDAMFANPNFSMENAMKYENPFHNALTWKDERMFIKLLAWDRMDAQLLCSQRDNNGLLIKPIFHMLLTFANVKIEVVQKMLSFSTVRYEVNLIFFLINW